MRAYLELMRLPNGVMTAIAVAIGFFIASNKFLITNGLLVACMSAFFIMSGGMSTNDYFDRKIDKKNKRYRPIPSGRIKAKNALYFGLALFALGIILSTFINEKTFAIALLASVLLLSYNIVFSRVGVIGNSIVAINTGLAFVYGEAVTGNVLSPLISILFLLAFLSTLSREIYKSIQDLRADKGFRKTLPMIVGIPNACWFAGFNLVLAILISPIPFFLKIVSLNYLYLIAFVDMGFLYTSAIAFEQRDYRLFSRQANHVKILQAIALLAFLLGI